MSLSLSRVRFWPDIRLGQLRRAVSIGHVIAECEVEEFVSAPARCQEEAFHCFVQESNIPKGGDLKPKEQEADKVMVYGELATFGEGK